MTGHGVETDEECLGNVAAALANGDETQDLDLPLDQADRGRPRPKRFGCNLVPKSPRAFLHIRAFNVEPNSLLASASDRVFATLRDSRIGVADGMKVDVEGNVYCTGPGGIWIFDKGATHLGTIATGAQTTHVAWGDADWTRLYFTTWQTLGRIRMKIPGIPVPAGR